MKKKIRDFFDNKGLETHKLVSKNPFGLDKRYIEHGMKAVYYRFSEGEQIKDIQIARNVWKEGLKAKSLKLKDLDLQFEERKIIDLTVEIEFYKALFYQTLILFCAFTIAYFLMIF